jgi:hypothetical protein
MTLRCAACGQFLIPAAQAPRQPDRHRWCSSHPGRHWPAGAFAPLLDRRPVLNDLDATEIDACFAAAKARLRRAAS